MAIAILLEDLKKFALEAQKEVDSQDIPKEYQRGWHDCCDMFIRSAEYTESKSEE